MTTSLLSTKLYIPPAGAKLVMRPRLVGQLHDGEDRKLILLSAPAGYGKSTLVSEWARHEGKSVAWLSLDENDNNLKRFLGYFVAAIQKIDGGVGEELLQTLEATDSPPIEPLFTTLINELSVSKHQFYLVLDDYHLITSQAIHGAMEFLLAHLPHNAHLIVSGRVDPPFSLARLRARGEMVEVRAHDLRFTESEVVAYLNDELELRLSAEQTTTLLARTEGWITGLQLAALSLRGRPDKDEFIAAFSGSHQHIIDYLLDEVLSREPEEVQAFLLQTSVLQRFNAALCDATLDSSTSSRILRHLHEANTFLIPLDEDRDWFRYHHLFAEFLVQRLREDAAHNVPELHRRASEWLKRQGLITEAIDHALLGGDFVQAAQLVEAIGPDMMMQSEFDQLATWLDAIPEDIVLGWPWLCIIRAWMYQRWARVEEGESYLAAAERALEDESTPEPVGGKSAIQGQVAAIRALFALLDGRLAKSREYATQALHHLPGDHFNRAVATDALALAARASGDLDGAIKIFKEARRESLRVGNRILAQAIILELGVTQALQGRLSQAADTFQQAIDLRYEKTQIHIPYASSACVHLANISREWNDLESALALLDEGIRIGEPARMVDAVISGYAVMTRVQLSLGNVDEAMESYKSAERMAQNTLNLAAGTRQLMIDGRVRLLLEQKLPSEALNVFRENDLDVDDEIAYFDGFRHAALARCLLYLGRWNPEGDELSRAQSLIARMLNIARSVGCTRDLIELLALQSLASSAQGLQDQALLSLREALGLAAEEKFVRTYVDEGEPMLKLVRQIEASGPLGKYIGRLLAAFERVDGEGRSTTSGPLVDPLTERELDVLRLLRTDLSGPEIAGELTVSLNTIRTHTKSIYAKLGVNSRRAAVRQAKELELL
ncbi:MAG TPA: LuxR C-terminal-related transcriptional regulator [Anaerolineales bacterium]|nr:LuxR C-terminal-related transcriptional regulator [Anaerolineales bacterium]